MKNTSLQFYVYPSVPESGQSENVKPEVMGSCKLVVITSRLDPQTTNLLENIIKATKLNENDQVCHLSDNSSSISSLIQHFPKALFWISGSMADILPTQIEYKKYQIFNISGREFVVTDPIQKIGGKKELKKQLWMILKTKFVA